MASLDRYKLSSATWDSDKEPHKFVEFMYLMSSMVRAIAHGTQIEDFLDRKLNRRKHQAVSTPSFLTSDPDFARPDGLDEALADPAAAPGGEGDDSDGEL